MFVLTYEIIRTYVKRERENDKNGRKGEALYKVIVCTCLIRPSRRRKEEDFSLLIY